MTLRKGFGDLGTWMGTAWGDYDNDSDLDHFSTSFGQVPLQDLSRLLPGFTLDPYPIFVPHGFWENVGDGAYFRQEAARAGFVGLGLGFSWGASFADFDNDGWEDLFFNGSYPDLGGLLRGSSAAKASSPRCAVSWTLPPEGTATSGLWRARPAAARRACWSRWRRMRRARVSKRLLVRPTSSRSTARSAR